MSTNHTNLGGKRTISVVIPLYYCSHALYSVISRCFDSLHGYSLELVVIDDCSPLEHDFPTTFRNKTNLGFTGTVNKGLELATGDIIIVMNDDIEMTKECMERFANSEDNCIASPADTASSPDDRFGACWGMTRSTYEKMGKLDERFKHFYSDREYYDRAKKLGTEITKWHDIVLSHPESSTYNQVDKEKLLKEDSKRFQRIIE
jgi:GT2 family glycosyltransferase